MSRLHARSLGFTLLEVLVALAIFAIVAAVVLTVWILAEVWSGRVKRIALLSVAATFGIGVSCGLPLYLYLRMRRG